MNRIYQVDGEIIFHDPGPELFQAFVEMDPSYSVQSIQHGPGFKPKFQLLREQKITTDEALIEMSNEELIGILNSKDNPDDNISFGKGYNTYSALDVLCTMALNALGECRLCGWNCGVNRYQVNGKCGLNNKAYASKPFIHIAEETVINPAIVTNFGGCALRCKYCIDYELWDVNSLPPSDPKSFWEQVHKLQHQGVPVSSIEFTNPTESLAGLMEILTEAPADFDLPVVINSHLYGSKLFYDIAGRIADVWLPDLRYGNDECAKSLSGIDHYMKYVKEGLDAMKGQDAKVIVRILVLPGHVSCCLEPAMRLLSEYREDVWVSILDQYVPENDAHLDSNLKRRPTKDEVSQVEALVDRYGLRNIASGSEDFWGA